MTTLRGDAIDGAPGVSALLVRDGRIAAIDGESDGDVVDAAGLTMAAGLIDLQINGAFGEDFTSDPSSMWRVGARLPEHGVTAFLPTIVTSPPSTVEAALDALAGRPPGYRGAEPLGLHVEGPMISPLRRGVHPAEHIREPSLERIAGWTRTRGVAMVTLAPELAGAGAVIDGLLRTGVVVSAGHSAADYGQAIDGFDRGITMVTHLFNAMEPFAHRAPGLVGATFDDQRVVAGVIVDGTHSHPAAVRAAWRLLGPDRLALVSDAVAVAGAAPTDPTIGATTIHHRGGAVTDDEGRLAGSALTLDQAVRNLIAFTGCTPSEALAAASAVPARVLGLEDRGRPVKGARADLVLLDSDLEVAATMVGGEMVWRR